MKRSRGAADEGMTLVELLVAMTIFSVVLTAVAVTFATVSRTSRTAQERNRVGNEVRASLEAIGGDVRGGVRVPGAVVPAFRIAKPNEVVMTSQVDSSVEPWLIRVELLDGKITETRWEPDTPSYTYIGTNTVVRVLSRHMVVASDQTFRYFEIDSTGSLDELVPADATVGLDADERARIHLVRVTLAARPSASPVGSQPIEVRGEIRVPNNALNRNS